MPAVIRDSRPGDLPAAYYVCMKTGDRGADGEPLFRDDPDALGRVFVGPYLKFEPDLALMLQDASGVCGYALASFDSRAFYDRYEREWRPGLCAQFPAPTGDRSAWTPLQWTYHEYHHPEYFCPEPYDEFPSHLHIDLLPRGRRQGHGQTMMNTLMDRLQARGSPGVHLGMHASNEPAYHFYRALGFHDLTRQTEGENDVIYMGKRLTL